MKGQTPLGQRSIQGKRARLAVRMSNLKKPPASWRCFPRHVLHGSAISPWRVPPRVPLLPQSVVTQPQQDEAQGAVQSNPFLPHQPANNFAGFKAQSYATLDVVSSLWCSLQAQCTASYNVTYMLCCAVLSGMQVALSKVVAHVVETHRSLSQAASLLCPALQTLAEAQYSTAQHSTAQHIIPEHLKSYLSFIGSLTGSHNSSEGELIRPGAAFHHALGKAHSLPKLCTPPKLSVKRRRTSTQLCTPCGKPMA